MVLGSTFLYGSRLMLVTRILRDSRIAARDAAAMPFPREETTPPVTKTYLAIYLARVGIEESTRDCALAQSGLIPCRRITSDQRVDSARIVAASSSGELPTGSAPSPASFSLTSGSFRMRDASKWSLEITSTGVPEGTISAYQETASKPGKPCSAIVGSSGITRERFRLAMPSVRSLPERT